MRLKFFGAESGKTHDHQTVANPAPMSRRAIEHNVLTAPGGHDGIGLKAFAVVNIADQNLLKGQHAAGIHEILVNGETALIIHLRIGDDRPVDF